MVRPSVHPSERHSRFLVWAAAVGCVDPPCPSVSDDRFDGLDRMIHQRFRAADAGWRAFRQGDRVWFQRPFPVPVTVEYHEDSSGIFVVHPGLQARGERVDLSAAREAIVPALLAYARRARALSTWERRHLLELVRG